jgi:hypothetical protein
MVADQIFVDRKIATYAFLPERLAQFSQSKMVDYCKPSFSTTPRLARREGRTPEVRKGCEVVAL